MKPRKLRTRILISFLAVIVALALSMAILGYYVIENDIMARAQTKVRNDLNSAREIYQYQVGSVRDVVRFTAVRFFIKDAISGKDMEILKEELGRIREAESLDVLTLTDASGKVMVRSRNPSVDGDSQADDELVGRILSGKQAIAGTLIVPREELAKEGEDLAEQAHIRFIPTPRAKQSTGVEETSGMMIRAAAPVFGYDGGLIGVLHGGTLLNRNYRIVDRIKETVYEGIQYKGIDTGTATIFQGDLRISTNVRAEDGRRAIGTRVSEEVYERVLTGGMQWVDRAFVVTGWFKTAYEPIRDVNGEIVGILYVGILEQPFVDMARNIFLFFVAIVSVAALLAGLFALLLTGAISRPVLDMVKATRRLSGGQLGYEVGKETGTIELDTLAKSFNKMSAQLREREDSLKTSNEKLAALNKTYLDLVGFVSHELKGIVATTIMNAAAVRDGLFGDINPKQKHSLEAVTKNLHYLRETVKKFLDLSRIEKG
ncbi:MAG: cache domain-containing protein, partial [Planctomycetota bacterium]